MSPRKTEQSELLKEQKRQQIMNVALDLFAVHSFHVTTIDQIAKKANISKGLMYNYFESKDDLLRTILIEGNEKLSKSFDPDKDGILTKEEFILYITDMLNQISQNPTYWKLYFALMTQPDVMKQHLEPLAKRSMQIFTMIVAYYERKGSENPFNEAYFVASAMKGIFMQYIYDPNYPIKDIRKMLIERFL
jgi:AcrR family transcriptional regulator